METIDLTELSDLHTDRSLVDEANRKPTAMSGEYRLQPKSAKPYKATDSERFKSPFPGRIMVNILVNLYNPKTAKVEGQMNIDVSPQEYRTTPYVEGQQSQHFKPGDPGYDKSLELDRYSKKWGEIEKIVNPDGKLSAAEIVQLLPNVEFSAYVKENFYDAANQRFTYKTDDERKELLAAGYTPRNSVFQIRKPK